RPNVPRNSATSCGPMRWNRCSMVAIWAECWRTVRSLPPGRLASCVIFLALALVACGCAGGAAGGGGRIEVAESRLNVIPGRTLVAPVRLAGEPPALAGRLDDGREVPVSLSWLAVRPSP